MRCIKMKIIGVLIFLINLMAIKCNAIPPKDRTSQAFDKENLNAFERNCPDFWKIIQNYNLVEWTDCQDQPDTEKKPTVEQVLQFACFLAKTMMMFICDNKLEMPNDYLSLPQKGDLCPFQFAQNITLLGHSPSGLVRELTVTNHCATVCNDLYEPRTQCVVLQKLNNYLKSVAEQRSRIGIVMPIESKPEISIPVAKAAMAGDSSPDQQTRKETTDKSKTETKSNKDATRPVKSQTDETKKSESKNHEHKIAEPKIPELITPDPEIPEPENPENKKLGLKEPENFSPKKSEVSGVSKTKFDIPESNEPKNFNEDTSVDNPNGFEDDGVMEHPMDSPKDEIPDVKESEITEKMDLEEKTGEVQIPFRQQELSSNGFLQPEDSHFFFYFIVVSSIIVIGYIGFHNKNKILAYALEGTSGRRNRRRPNPARYRKLETNLEEAIASNASETIASSVVY